MLLMSIALPGQHKILVAAASDLRFAMDSVISAFTQVNPGEVEITYGSSGKLCEQIINGAPFDIFFSADISYPEKLKQAHQTASDIYEYGKGRIVIWSKRIDAEHKAEKALLEPGIQKIAIANPAHAPYGKRAMESLEYFKLLGKIKPKLVYGENISQTAHFVSTGAADIGIIALSLALSPPMKEEKGNYYLIPESSHQPLIQGAVITEHGKENKLAASFFSFIKSATAIAILKHYGL